MTANPVGEKWQQLWLPVFPLASDELRAGVYRHPREAARGMRYVEANPQQISNLLVVDVDHSDAMLRALWDRQAWRPNAVVENPRNGHAHAVWALSEPFTRTEYARRAPLAYAAAVTEGLRRSVDGDKGYSGLLTKNPEHPSWDAHWVQDRLYTLGQLHEHLDEAGFMPPPRWREQRRKSPVGLGRNCSLFETVRTWAYPAVRRHFGDPNGLHKAIAEHARERNQEFAEPLCADEVRHLVTSVWKWIVTRSDMWRDGPAVYEATLTLIQSARGKKGGNASAASKAMREQELWETIT